MARNRETKIELTAYDDLFQTDESRAEAALSKIRDIPLSEIDEFPDHPFKVLMDEDMEQLVESIKRNGVMTPATVRLKEDGRYELISGHRRKKACELAGLETLKCEVKELTRDEAIIVMLEVIYADGETEIARVRKAPGTEDISGDYNAYDAQDVAVGDVTVTMKSADGLVKLAIWQDGGYTYAVSVEAGLSADAMAELVSQIG